MIHSGAALVLGVIITESYFVKPPEAKGCGWVDGTTDAKILIRFTNKEVIAGTLCWIACEVTCALPDAIPIL